MITDIEFKEYKRKDDIHGSVLYPAVMVAPVQRELLKELLKKTNINSVFDPFHGSGTALYEAMEISNDLHLYGCDINPLANLITKVKLKGISDNINKSIKQLKTNLEKRKNDTMIYTFKNSQKWFRDDIALELTKIRNSIMQVSCRQDRLYFWMIFSDIVRKFSNTRSDTYKLHSKEKSKILSMPCNVQESFIKLIEMNIDKFNLHAKNCFLYKGDVISKIKEFSNKNFDITITSPPYGDNATTVPYGQFSILSLYWIDDRDLELEGWEFETYSKIDSNSMGGINSNIKISKKDMRLLEPYIRKISESKVKKVLRFFSDYFNFLLQMCRVTKKYVVMTLGNRTVDGVKIDLTSITELYLKEHGFEKYGRYVRKIYNKRIPSKTSQVNDAPVSSMNEEYIIIYKRVVATNSYYIRFYNKQFFSTYFFSNVYNIEHIRKVKYYNERDGSLTNVLT